MTESSLKTLFSAYGTVLDASIKKSTVDEVIITRISNLPLCNDVFQIIFKVTKFQSGFGFIHYSNKRDGIEAAFKAAMTLYDERIDNVNYTCKISHALEKYLTSGQLEAAAEMEQRKHQQLSPIPIPPHQTYSATMAPRPIANSSPIENSPRSQGSRMLNVVKTSSAQKIGSQSPIFDGPHSSIKKKPIDSYYQSSTSSGSPRATAMYNDEVHLSSLSLDDLPSTAGRYLQKQPQHQAHYNQISKPNNPQQYDNYSSRWSPQHQQTMDVEYSNNHRIRQSSTIPSDDAWEVNFGSHSSANTNMESRSSQGSASLKTSSGSQSLRGGIINNTLRSHHQVSPGKLSQHNEGFESNVQYQSSLSNSLSFDNWDNSNIKHKTSEIPRSRPQVFSSGLDIPINGSSSSDLTDSEWNSLRGTFSSSSSSSALHLSPAIRAIQHSNNVASSTSQRFNAIPSSLDRSIGENFQEFGDRKSPYHPYGVVPPTTTASAGTYSPHVFEKMRSDKTTSYDSGLYGGGPSIASEYQKPPSMRTISESSESMMSRSMDFSNKTSYTGYSNINNSNRLSTKISQSTAALNRNNYSNTNQRRANSNFQSLPTDNSTVRSRSPPSPVSNPSAGMHPTIDNTQKSPTREREQFMFYEVSGNRDNETTHNSSNMRLDAGYSSSSPSTAFGESPSLFHGDILKRGNTRSSPFGFEIDQSPYSITSSSPMHFNSSIQTTTYNSANMAAAYDSSSLRTRGGLEKEIYENFGLYDDLEFNHPTRTSPTMHTFNQQSQQQRLPPKHPPSSTLQMMKSPIRNEDMHYPDKPTNDLQWLAGPDYGFNIPTKSNEKRTFKGTEVHFYI